MSAPDRQPYLPLVATFGDPESAAIWSPAATIAAWCAVEVALAQAQAELGEIPAADAAAIVAWADPARVAAETIRDGARTVGYPILPLLGALRADAPPGVAASLHWGATTQDIMDSALALQLARAIDRADLLAAELGDALVRLTELHRATPMAGRTHDQIAVPTTFGAKLAVYLDELLRHRARLRTARRRVALVSLFGAGGTAAALGPRSAEIRAGVARRLGLMDAGIPWHVARDGVAEAGFALAAAAATASRLAKEIVALSRSEVDEVREAGGHHRGASSTMPQKVNPIASETIVGFSLQAAAQVPVLLAAMQPRHERAAGEWQAEWDALPLLCTAAAGALATAGEAVRGLRVDPGRMARNLDLEGGMVMSEAVMMALAPHVGRGPAHDIVYAACTLARAEDRPLAEALELTLAPGLRTQLPPIATLLDPAAYLGEAVAIADRAAAAWRSGARPGHLGEVR